MNIYETIELLKTKLTDGSTDTEDLLYGINILTDSYSDLTKNLPAVLIEAEKTEFDNSARGYVIEQEHFLSLSCIVSAQNTSFDKFKSEVNQLAKNTIEKLNSVTDYKILNITPVEQAHCEIMIGSLKATAVIISAKIRTYWKEQL